MQDRRKVMVKIGSLSMSDKEPFEAFNADFEPQLLSKSTQDLIEEYFHDEWQRGKEIRKVIITQRLYQTSPNSVQA